LVATIGEDIMPNALCIAGICDQAVPFLSQQRRYLWLPSLPLPKPPMGRASVRSSRPLTSAKSQASGARDAVFGIVPHGTRSRRVVSQFEFIRR
jgi:hypothetical protein